MSDILSIQSIARRTCLLREHVSYITYKLYPDEVLIFMDNGSAFTFSIGGKKDFDILIDWLNGDYKGFTESSDIFSIFEFK